MKIPELLAVCDDVKAAKPEILKAALRCLAACFELIDHHHFMDGHSLTGDEMAAKLRRIKERFDAGEFDAK